MPKHLKFGEVKISCEGFENSNDPYVLEGSCGVLSFYFNIPFQIHSHLILAEILISK
jgi:hypothetical protein